MSIGLWQIDSGTKVTISELSGSEHYLELIKLGLLPGDQLEVMGKAPFGGPIALKHLGHHFMALRKDLAERIQVQKI